MIIPKSWICVSHEVKLQNGIVWPIRTWGWGETEEEARHLAEKRAGQVRERLLQQDIPDQYGYSDRPLREEIVEAVNDNIDECNNIITRNRYGALILNSTELLILDIDYKIQKRSLISMLFGHKSEESEENQLNKLKKQLMTFPEISFRIYKTAAGFRSIATNRVFHPLSDETKRLMQATNTDTLYQKLCHAQESFRARLTPKPWRCGIALPPNAFPRTDAKDEEKFIAWKRKYEQETQKFSTCRYIETVGIAVIDSRLSSVISVHDKMTRCTSNLPLA